MSMTQIALLNSLAGVRRRVRLLSILHGLGGLLSATVALLLATVLLDYTFNLDPILRVLLILAALGTIGYVAARQVFRPMAAKLRISDVAGRIEQAFPAFDDRLRSTVEFATRPTPGSEAMKQRVVDQATQLANQIDLGAVVRPQPALGAVGIGLASVAFCVVLALAVGPEYFNAALSRLLAPFSGTPWPKRTLIQPSPLPQKIAAGTPLEVRIKLVKGDHPSAKAFVSYQYEANGPVQQEVMNRNSDGTYTASLDTRIEPGKAAGMMTIWTRSGDDSRQMPMVQIVPPLTIQDVQAIVSPPKYAAGFPISTIDLSAAPATITLGSPVELRVKFTKPLVGNSVHLQFIDSPLPNVQWDPISGGASTAVGHFITRQAMRFNVVGTDQDGLSNSGIEEFQILVRPDQLPLIQFEKPLRNQDCTPNATIPIQALAEDDFGVKNVEMVIRRLGDNHSWTIPFVQNFSPVGTAQWAGLESTGEHVRYRLNWDWDLAAPGATPLKPGDELEFYLRVQDNYLDDSGKPHDPAYSESGRLRLTVISQEQLGQQVSDELARLRSNVDETRKANEGLRAGTKSLQDDTKNKNAMDRADRAMAGQLANDQNAAASQTKQIADKLGDLLDRMAQNKSNNSDMMQAVADARRLLNDAAENPMKDAAAKLAETADQQNNPSPAQRSANLDQAQQNQAAASSQLQAAMQKMGAEASLTQFLKQVSALLEAQRNLSAQTAQAGKSTLGKTPDQLTDQEKKNLSDLAQKQQDLAQQTDQARQQMDKAADQQARSDPNSSQALKQAAQTAQQQNVSGQMNQAAQAEQQNQQANAQGAQRQAELGLMMMQQQLREAENRRLMELVKNLETAQELIADLVQQQAGHNLDNLMLQGPVALATAVKSGPELVADLVLYSQRDPQHLPAAPLLATQVALQEQTERNTRNIVSVVQALPEGADPAAQLTRASQRMGRAITYLQDSHLPDAYQPPQAEAFAALVAAKDLIDKQADEARQKMQDQQRATLREQFVQIREQQVKVNAGTSAIDATPRTADGQLEHTARANIGLLSNQQSDLAGRAAKLGGDLTGAGSVAYVYANDDIVKRMNLLSQRLGKLDPGKQTQQSQARVVLELDDMIKDLSIKPKQSQFSNTRNSNNGGGAAGQKQQQAPRLPPEAEIRLVQDMQRILNQDTKDVDAKDKSAVMDLGTRQGDLRHILDDLLNKASDGEATLGPEPANKQTLPEEAKDDDLDLQELKDSALNAKPDAQSVDDGTEMLGIRMGRAHQRLALDLDPGETTQRIQERIVIEMDALAKQAQEQEQQARPGSTPRQRQQQQPGEQQQRQNPGNAIANGQRQQRPGVTPAASDRRAGPPLENVDISATVNELKDSWGRLSPRQRAAVMEGSTDQTIQKFKDFVDGYYRTLATKNNNQ
jgi:hypothetical protein